MTELNIETSHRATSHTDYSRPKTKIGRNELLEKLLALLTTDVQDLANSVWETLDNDKDVYHIHTTEVAKLKRENEDIRRELGTSRKSTDELFEMKKRYNDLEKRFNKCEERSTKLKNIEKKYLRCKESKDELQKSFDKEKLQMQQTIKEQKIQIQALEHAESKIGTAHRERYELRTTDNHESERYSTFEKQLKDIRDKLRKTEEELDDTKTRLNQSLKNKLLEKNPNIDDLSDRNRPTKLAEVYQEIYDNEWTEAFEKLIDRRVDDEEAVISTLVSILVETQSVCEKIAEKQMNEIQLAITQDDIKVDATLISSIKKPLKECRKAVAVYSGKQVYKKHLKELERSSTSTARKARSVPKYLEACFNLCWLMTVQDPPLCFGPDVRRGDVFDTDLYKAYTQRGNTVAYVVWPALLLHKGGAVLYKGVAQGKEDHSQRTKCAPNLYERHLNSDETDDLFSSPDRYHKVYKDEKTSYDIDRLYSTKATDHHRISGTDNDYDWRTDNSLPHGHDTSDYSLSDLNDASRYKTQGYDEYKRPYNDYQASISHRETKVSPGTSSRYRSKTDYTQKIITPRNAWRY